MKNKILHIFIFVFFLLFLTSCDLFGGSTTETTTTQVTTTEEITTEPGTTDSVITTKSDLTLQLEYIYNLAIEAEAFSGTYEEWLESVTGPQGEPGCQVLLRVAEGYIQWQYDGDTSWSNLVLLADLVGPTGLAGTDGQEVDFQVSGNYIQWKYTDDTEWTNLLSITELIGPAGVAGREPTLRVSEGYLQWTYINDPEWYNLIEIASLVGTSGEDGVDGREIILQVAEGYIQWQYSGDTTWSNLIDLATLTGADGTNGNDGVDGVDGREVLFQVAGGYIQWQYSGDTTWTNLIDLATLTGADGINGIDGTDGTNGVDGLDGREVFFQVSNGYIQWQHSGDTTWTNLIDLATLTGADGINGTDGIDGKEVFFQVSNGYIQWQYFGDTTWTNLIDLATLIGPAGADGTEITLQVNGNYIQWEYVGTDIWYDLIDITTLVGQSGTNGEEVILQVANNYIQWKYTNEDVWSNLISLDSLIGPTGNDGADGKEVLFQVSNGYIQWQYSGDETWTNLIDIITLTGADGANGIDGVDGVDGKEVLFQVAGGYIQWQYSGDTTWTNLIDLATLTGADGTNGTDGIDGREVEFIVEAGSFMYRYVGDELWTALFSMESLIGESGTNGIDGREVLFQVSSGYIQWQYSGDSTWTNLIDIATLTGADGTNGTDGVDGVDGREVSFQVAEGYIQWKYSGDSSWTNLIDLATLTGADGTNGTDGVDGVDGREVLFQVAEGYIQWQYSGDIAWTNLIEVATLVGDTGTDGVGISNMEINELGELIVTFTDTTTQNLGKVVNTYTVIFKDYNNYIVDVQIIIYGEDATAPTDPTRNGYTFTGWNGTYTNITSDVTLLALYTVNTYTVEFDSAGGSEVTTLTDIPYGSTLSLTIPDKEGYYFAGWFVGTTINDSQFTSNDTINNNMTLYARWEEAGYIVNFVDYDATVLLTQRVTFGFSATAPTNPTRVGYIFDSWDVSFMQVTSNLTVTALYIPIDYTLAFDTNGGTLIEDYIAGYETDLPEFTNPAKVGHDFIGWYVDSELTTPYSQTTMPLDGMTVYAKWELSTYQIIFNTTGGDPITSIDVTYGTVISSVPDATKLDCVFSGWQLNDSDFNLPYTYLVESNITLVASWIGLESGIMYELVGEEVTITGYSGSATDLIIPDTITGYPVTTIAENAFKDNATIVNLTFGQFVTTIEDNAFMNMTNLQTIALPASAVNFGTFVFYGANSLETMVLSSEMALELRYLFGNNINYVPDSLSKIKYANGSAYIDKTLLSANLNGVTIELADDCTAIADNQFMDLVYITEVIIPEGVISIGANAFRNTNITSITLPNTLETIGNTAFASTYYLTSITLPNSLTDIYGYAFEHSGLTSIIIPSSVTNIGVGAFQYCYDLVSVTFAENSQLQTINTYTFNHCENLPSIEIPASVITIDNYAFFYCYDLTELTFEAGSNLQYIKYESFYKADIRSIVFPVGLISIESSVFEDNFNLEQIFIPSSVTSISGNAFVDAPRGFLIFTDCLSKPAGWGISNEYNWEYIYGYIETIDNGEFIYATTILNEAIILGLSPSNTNTEIVFPSTFGSFELNRFAIYSFAYNEQITSITIPNNILRLGKYAFYSMPNLANITFEDLSQLQKIDFYAFAMCDSLTSITIPDNILVIEQYAFYYCSNLAILTFGEYSQVDTIEYNAFYNTAITEVYLPDTLVNFNDSSFRGYPARRVNLFTSLESQPVGWVGEFENDFYTVIWGYVETIDNGEFVYATTTLGEAVLLDISDSNTNTEIIVPSSIGAYSVNRIPVGLFYNNLVIESVFIPNSIQTIAGYSFTNVPNLHTVIFEAGIQLDTIEDNTFESCYSLKNIIIPDSVTLIESYAFANTGLEEIVIPNSVIIIEERAFQNSSSLSLLYFEKESSVTTLGYHAFYNTALRNVVIPISVTTMGERVFYSTEPYNFNTRINIYAEAESKPANWNSEYTYDAIVYWGITSYDYIDDISYVIKSDNNVSILGFAPNYSSTDIVIPETIETLNVTEIAGMAFCYTDITSLYIPRYINIIGENAFHNSTDLISVVIAEGSMLTSLERLAFYNCTNLIDINLENCLNLITINRSAFADCQNLQTVILPINIEVIYSDAFYHNYSMSMIYVEASTRPAGWATDWSVGNPVTWGYTDFYQSTITFETNGGNTIDPIKLDEGELIPQPDDPTKEGYTFSGWYLDSEFTEVYVFDVMPVDNFTIYAKWTINTYSITYKDYDGTVLQTGNYDYNVDISGVTLPTDPTRTGYTFAEWDGTLPSTMPSNDIVITALYSINTYSITYKDYDGTILNTYYFDYDEEITLTPPTDPVRGGYTFTGWDTSLPTNMPANDIIVTATYSINQYNLTFKDWDGTVLQTAIYDFEEDLSGVTPPTDPTRTGYTFTGWDKTIPATMRDYDYIITAQYTINEYTISFDSNDGTAVTAITQNYDTDVTQPPNPTKLGSIFDGWFTDDDTFLIEYTFTTMPAEDITLYAKWIVVSYKLQYVDYDDTVIQLELYEYGDDLSGVTAPTDPTRTGYTFNGWDVSVPATMPAEDVTITATYTINNYLLIYKDYEGTILKSELYPYSADLSSALPPNDPTRTGYTFSGWDISVPANMPANDVIVTATYTINQYTIEFVDWDSTVLQTADYDYGASLSGVTAPTDPTRVGYTFNSWDSSIPATMPLGGVTITATYDINQYTITFNSNGGTAVTSITQNYNTAVSEPTSPTKDGYTFDGWYTDDTTFINAYTFTTMPAENITLYAKWTCYLSYTLKGDSTYEITGLVGTPSNVVIPTTIDGVTVTSIADDAFTSCTSMTSIVIADTVTTIGSYVFNGCDNLQTAYIPDSVVTMGGYVFIYIDTATIYCEAASEPTGWDSNWDFWCGSTIVWGYTG